MKIKPIIFSGPSVRKILSGEKTQTRRIIRRQNDHRFYSGGLLWVRETWTQDGVDTSEGDLVRYRADGEAPEHLNVKWRSSMFMPRKYSRITLEIVSTRVERVQDITEADAKAEGAEQQFRMVIPVGGKPDGCERAYSMPVSYRAGFANLWNSINLKRGYGWDTNPRVIAIEFKVCECAGGIKP